MMKTGGLTVAAAADNVDNSVYKGKNLQNLYYFQVFYIHYVSWFPHATCRKLLPFYHILKEAQSDSDTCLR